MFRTSKNVRNKCMFCKSKNVRKNERFVRLKMFCQHALSFTTQAAKVQL